MGEVGRERGLEAGSGDGKGGADSLEPQGHYEAASAHGGGRLVRSAAHTAPAIAYCCVKRGHEVGHDGVGIVEASQDRDDIGAGVGVFLGESSI